MYHEPAQPKSVTPLFESVNGDADIGDGEIQMAYQVMGGFLYITIAVTWGLTSTLGTGNIKCPLPPGYTIADVNYDAMATTGPFSVGASLSSGIIGGAFATAITLVLGVAGTSLNLFAYNALPLIPGDFVITEYKIPIKT